MSPPIFIVGPSRSGTTLLSVMMDAHPELAILPETWMVVDLERLGAVRRFRSRWVYRLFMEDLWSHTHQVDPIAARAIAETAAETPAYRGSTAALVERIARRFCDARSAQRWGEKTPAHTFRIGQIRRAFGDVTFVRLARDPRDILASYAKAWNRGVADEPYLGYSAGLVLRYLREVLVDDLGGILLRYEDLVTHTEAKLRELCAALHCDFDPAMLAFTHSERSRQLSQDAKHRQLIRPPDPKRIGNHGDVLSELQIARIEALFEREMAQLGYARTQPAPTDPESRAWIAAVEKSSHTINRGRNWLRTRLRGEAKVLLHELLGSQAERVLKRGVATRREDWLRRLEALPPAR